MKFYKDNENNIFAYELDGSQDYLIGDKTPITLDEVYAMNKAKEDAYKLTAEYRVQEAQAYLDSTDYMMTADYDKDTTEVRVKRAEARVIIRNGGM